MITLYFNTRHNTELTLSSDNLLHLLDAITDIRALLNGDSYIGFNNYLNHHANECLLSVRTKENVIIYIIKDIYSETFYLRAYETDEGVKLSIITSENEFMFNKITKQLRGK